MGKVIRLTDWASRRGAGLERSDAPVLGGSGVLRRLPFGQVQFAFDLACPLSYLAAEQVERTLGQVEWIAVAAVAGPASGLVPGPASGLVPNPAWSPASVLTPSSPDLPDFGAQRAQAQRAAQAQHVPLVWPERYPQPVPRAMRAACHAVQAGFGARFGLAALRLAFCGGFDLEEDCILAEAAAAAGIGVDETLAAADEPGLDDVLRGNAEAFAAAGVAELPAIRVGPRVLRSHQVVAQAAALMALRPA